MGLIFQMVNLHINAHLHVSAQIYQLVMFWGCWSYYNHGVALHGQSIFYHDFLSFGPLKVRLEPLESSEADLLI